MQQQYSFKIVFKIWTIIIQKQKITIPTYILIVENIQYIVLKKQICQLIGIEIYTDVDDNVKHVN